MKSLSQITDEAHQELRRATFLSLPLPNDADQLPVDCANHDAFTREVYERRGLYAFHPQDSRLTDAQRALVKAMFRNLHGRRGRR